MSFGWIEEPTSQQLKDAAKRRRVLQGKLDVIAAWIADQADQLPPADQGDITKVPCPTRDQWKQLEAGGRNAHLPSSASLLMSVPDSLRAFASQHGITDMLVAWFEAARSQLVATRHAAQGKKS